MSTQVSFLDFQDAKQRILNEIKPSYQTETIELSLALDRIIAKPIISPIDVPGFNNSAMDGYAVRLSDLKQTNILPIGGKILAGDEIPSIWPIGTCLRIMTGAPVPADTDAIVMQEDTEQTNGGILFKNQIKHKQNIRYAGEDVKKNTEVISIGKKLTIPLLSTLASLGIANITVYNPIRVALFSTGNELVSIGQSLASGQIYDSNRFTLKLMLQQLNCQVIDLGIIPDDPQQIKAACIKASEQADLIITSGGVSVGDADYTKQVLDELGEISFWKIAMKPGKPFAYGKINQTLFCGLPGNPVSSIITFYQLVQPLIMKMSGLKKLNFPLQFSVKTADTLKKTAGRLDFQRGYLSTDNQGNLTVYSNGHQGSHITQSLNNANCFIILEKDRGTVTSGEWVTVELFNNLMS